MYILASNKLLDFLQSAILASERAARSFQVYFRAFGQRALLRLFYILLTTLLVQKQNYKYLVSGGNRISQRAR